MVIAKADPTAYEIDVNGLVDEQRGVVYIGKARRDFNDRWKCLANVGGMLWVVEVSVKPTVHVDGDPGDEDDRWNGDRDMFRRR